MDTRPWPPSPILAKLPGSARLARTYDAASLRAELENLAEAPWAAIEVNAPDGTTRESDSIGWQSLRLRHMAAAPRPSAGDFPYLRDYAGSTLLEKMPYLARLLGDFPAPLRGARLMATRPDTHGPTHSDEKCGLPWGTVRLHVPISTTPQATLTVDGEAHCWNAGDLWYGDFSRPHAVANTDEAVTRVHLVVDADVTKELMALFPEEFRTPSVLDNTLYVRPEVPLGPVDVRSFRCEFDMPALFTSFLETDAGIFQRQGLVPAAVDCPDGTPVLFIEGIPRADLIHLGEGEFRLGGWTMERTILIRPNGTGGAEITFRIRNGDECHTLSLHGDRLS
ncbi:aspartyl/asparaginyl beta-hydroxylase domain-containing protein [Streptomyces sp. NBC_01794]|uniref:aspartyl/asparaginyl beta-hydroxylase domain-containing protein n=1 Tax=Streptomyces sp. NBC_01794 TaxID=2975942 RepID=UPI0030920F86|nr:aspartyl/asparaginyl beta-hydroxylase domain-containing protein [Streptomyces sp. NBC_01794]WSB05148.1 aspartyl/asparaginyl beta-hydroxylase domain-containing protein [Streptomyces sp. NBC_01794]